MPLMDQPQTPSSPRLTDQVSLPGDLTQERRRSDDQAWIDVIQRMDDIYADLVLSQVELERKNAELEDAQKFIHSILSSMSEILIVTDINGRVQRVNSALCDTLGLEPDAVEGNPMDRLFTDEQKPLLADFQQHMRSGTRIDCEADLIDARGEPVPMAINCNARYDHDNRLSGLVITGRPLRELRKAYAELKEAHEKLKTTQQQLLQSEKLASLGRLVAGVAHELNNPISFLFANMHALKGYQRDLQHYLDAIHSGIDDAAREHLRESLGIDRMLADIGPLVDGSLEGAERVRDIVQNLRKFATPQKQSRRDFDLVRVVRRALSWVQKSHPSKTIVRETLPSELWLHNNEGHIHQILVNLFQNAIDAMAGLPTLKIDIRLEHDDHFVRLHIRDHGPGIPEENRLQIFDPFFTTKPVGHGTGLGLYISYGLATDQCNGRLEYTEPDGPGAEFILSLPIKALTEDAPS